MVVHIPIMQLPKSRQFKPNIAQSSALVKSNIKSFSEMLANSGHFNSNLLKYTDCFSEGVALKPSIQPQSSISPGTVSTKLSGLAGEEDIEKFFAMVDQTAQTLDFSSDLQNSEGPLNLGAINRETSPCLMGADAPFADNILFQNQLPSHQQNYVTAYPPTKAESSSGTTAAIPLDLANQWQMLYNGETAAFSDASIAQLAPNQHHIQILEPYTHGPNDISGNAAPKKNPHAAKGLSQYFWKINSHSTGRVSSTPSQSNAEPKSRQQRNIRANLAEAELERTESSILHQDVQERIPDPMKLILLREKMQNIVKIMDNLQNMHQDNDNFRVMKKREKNRLASKCCRLKKKALFEANVIIRNGLHAEKEAMKCLISKLRDLLRAYITQTHNNYSQNSNSQQGKISCNDSFTSVSTSKLPSLQLKVEELIYFTLGNVPRVAGRTQDYVTDVIDSAPQVYDMQMKSAMLN